LSSDKNGYSGAESTAAGIQNRKSMFGGILGVYFNTVSGTFSGYSAKMCQ
jgi:hypothetical protein